MPYTSQADLTDRYGERLLVELTDRGEVATGTVSTDAVDRAIADADALIDGYLGVRYALPLAATPPLVADIARAVAIHKLHVYTPSEKVEADFRHALKMLDDIAAGRLRLPVAGVEPEGQGGSGARMTDRDRPFTGDNLKGFV